MNLGALGLVLVCSFSWLVSDDFLSVLVAPERSNRFEYMFEGSSVRGGGSPTPPKVAHEPHRNVEQLSKGSPTAEDAARYTPANAACRPPLLIRANI